MVDTGAPALSKNVVVKLLEEATEGGRIESVLLETLSLFGNDGTVPIIGNSTLNIQTESLATVLASYISKANKSAVVPTVLYCLKSL